MQSIHTLSIDLETRSGADLKKTGVYRYTEDPDFDILLFGYSADGSPVQVIDLAQQEPIPEDILQAILNSNTQKWAFNASFERIPCQIPLFPPLLRNSCLSVIIQAVHLFGEKKYGINNTSGSCFNGA